MDRTETYRMERLSSLINTGIFKWHNDCLESYQENQENSPLCHSEELRNRLIQMTDAQKAPYIFRDEYHVYFACIKNKKSYYFLGPMRTEAMGRVELHQFYKKYGITEKDEKQLKRYTVPQILDWVGLIGNLVADVGYTDGELLYENRLIDNTRKQEEQEKVLFGLKEDEEELYHHTYQEERKLLDSVREGKVQDALQLNRDLDVELGKLSLKELNHWRNVVIVGITLCTRAAIEGGVSPAVAYRISDFYIQKSDSCKDIAQLLEYRNHAVEDLTTRVLKKKENRSTSNYVERCKDYVKKHYREKIYLEEIAEVLGISNSYLSRLFKRETGIHFQDYINQVRVEHAANLLLYSEEKISRIAEYVNFPSQSYLGKIFKKYKHISPRKYRETNKPSEFITTK